MSGIAVTEDAVNLYYYMKAKSVVCTQSVCFAKANCALTWLFIGYNLMLAVPLGIVEAE